MHFTRELIKVQQGVQHILDINNRCGRNLMPNSTFVRNRIQIYSEFEKGARQKVPMCLSGYPTGEILLLSSHSHQRREIASLHPWHDRDS
uniref:Uncharacterized protein n=1 Tax=Anguilla anguilla TaxID=7936 RepID=A0A0E9SVG5_ANGAN